MNACDFFGGKTRLRSHLVDLIKNARTRRGISPCELYHHANLDSGDYPLSIVEDIEARRVHIDSDYTLSCFATIGIPTDTALPLPELTREQREYWTRRFAESGEGPVGGTILTSDDLGKMAIGDVAEVRGTHMSSGFDSEIALQMYIRFCALRELDTT